MIDLHCHILPGVDDGSASEEESCMMAETAAASGVTVIAATPHCNVPGSFQNTDPDEVRRQLEQLRAALGRQGIPVELRSGMEVFVTPQVPELLRRGRLLTLNDSRYLLVEFGFDEPLAYAEEMLEAIRAEGVGVPAALGAGGLRPAGQQGEPVRHVRPPGGGHGPLVSGGGVRPPHRQRRPQPLPPHHAADGGLGVHGGSGFAGDRGFSAAGQPAADSGGPAGEAGAGGVLKTQVEEKA